MIASRLLEPTHLTIALLFSFIPNINVMMIEIPKISQLLTNTTFPHNQNKVRTKNPWVYPSLCPFRLNEHNLAFAEHVIISGNTSY